jgi:hypothetical protein
MAMPGFTADLAVGRAAERYQPAIFGTGVGGAASGVAPAFVSCHIEFHQPAAGETCYAHEWWGGPCAYLTSCNVGF